MDTAGQCYDLTTGVVFIGNADANPAATEAIDLAGGKIVARGGWEDAGAVMQSHLSPHVLMMEATGVDAAMLDAILPVLGALALAQRANIVVAGDVSQIDLISAYLFGAHVQLLCLPDMTDRVVALTIAAGTDAGTFVAQADSNAQTERYRRLNEEVGRIAETLARLAREDGGVVERTLPSVGDRRGGYGAPPTTATINAHDIRQLIRARRMRSQFFVGTLFEDPAWDMLLDLYAAELELGQVSVSSLCIAAAVAPTTALRWIARMTLAGLFVREPDPFDRRRAFMALSAAARTGLTDYFASARRAGLSIA